MLCLLGFDRIFSLFHRLARLSQTYGHMYANKRTRILRDRTKTGGDAADVEELSRTKQKALPQLMINHPLGSLSRSPRLFPPPLSRLSASRPHISSVRCLLFVSPHFALLQRDPAHANNSSQACKFSAKRKRPARPRSQPATPTNTSKNSTMTADIEARHRKEIKINNLAVHSKQETT